jgi:hypothetical protein
MIKIVTWLLEFSAAIIGFYGHGLLVHVVPLVHVIDYS